MLRRVVKQNCEPYLPWKQPNADQLDHGIRVLPLNSPEDVLKIKDLLK
jgi:hypothetical protein